MGGMDGFGPVVPEKNEPVFHAEWERRMFGLVLPVVRATQSAFDEFRHAVERIPPAQYLASSYYERWLAAAETLLVERGVVTREELLAKENASIDPALIANAVPARGPTPRQRQITEEAAARALRQRRSRARAQPESIGAHSPAALCARQVRSGRARLGRVRLCRHQSTSRGRQAAALLLGRVRRARVVGQISEQPRARLHRFVGRLPGAGRYEIEIAKAQTRDAQKKELSHEWRSS